ncbi:MAG: TolC family protein [Bryobacteraceae bacterium]|nr:TolC family protein [Bryobacteraceae bacterium]
MGNTRPARVLCGCLLVLAIPPARGQGPEAGTPVTVEGAVKEALERNLGLLAERYNISIAEAGLIAARLRPNPVLSTESTHLDVLGTGYDAINGAGPAEFSVRTDFVLERGGKRQRRIEVAQSGIQLAQLQLLDSVRRLIVDVQSAFVNLQLAKANLALAQESLKAFTQIVGVNAARVKSGDLAEVELVRSRIAALQFRSQVKQAELSVRSRKNRLQFLLGRTQPRADFDITGDFRKETAPMELAQIRAKAEQLRPDLQALRREQARSQAELRLQLAQGKVDYVVGTEYRRQQGLAGTGNSLGIFFQTNLPVFNRNQGEIERARREQARIEARLRELEATIALEVENAYQEYATALTLLTDIERDMLAQARDVRAITEFSYTRGEASLIEFLDAQRAFNETMQAYNESRAEYSRSLYGLQSAAGMSGENR